MLIIHPEFKLRANKGIQKANTALLKFGSKADLAAQLQMSRTTINKFFKREPVLQKKFSAIFKKLKLILEEVADLPNIVESEPVEQNQDNNGDIDELVREVRSHCCDKILHLYSKIRLLNRQQIDVDKLYVDVYCIYNITAIRGFYLIVQNKILPLENGEFLILYFDQIAEIEKRQQRIL